MKAEFVGLPRSVGDGTGFPNATDTLRIASDWLPFWNAIATAALAESGNVEVWNATATAALAESKDVAVWNATASAAPVKGSGDGNPGQAEVVRLASDPFVVPVLLCPTIRKWYIVLQLRLETV